MSVVLAIDTAAARLQLALLTASDAVDVSIDDLAKGHAEIIFDRIAALLARNGIGYDALDRIAVTTGPGSFTGLRIGLSAARGLGLALDIPVIGVPTLAAISLSAPPGLAVAVLVDAHRDEAYFQRFTALAMPAEQPQLLPVAEARGLLSQSVTLIEAAYPDIAALARFAAGAEPSEFPPEASYVRPADAKPQEKARVARVGVS